MTERARDEYNRPLYRHTELLPENAERFSVWRERLVHPDAIVITSQTEHDRRCRGLYNGWMPSGDWWFHCGVCRPHRRES